MHEHGEERVLEACRGPSLCVPRSWWHAGRAATTYHSTNKRASSVEIDLGLDNGQDGRGALAPALIALGPVGSEGLDGGFGGLEDPCIAAAARLGTERAQPM